MTTFELTPEQEALFRTVLLYISNERKSTLIQLLDSERAKSITDVVEEFGEHYPSVDSSYLEKNGILSIFNKALSPLELATEEQVPGRRSKDVKAFRLTEAGEEVKSYAGFALERMVREFDQSIYPILSVMNSTADRRRPSEAVGLLSMLDQSPISVADLVAEYPKPEYYSKNMSDHLAPLSGFKDAKGNPIPLIEIKGPTLEEGMKGYQWIKGSTMPTTKKPTERWRNLVYTLYSDPARAWTEAELARECGYDRIQNLNRALLRLESKGNLMSDYSRELRTVNITSHGRRLIYSLFEPIRGAIAGDEVSSDVIDRNKPSPDSVTRVLGHYVGIKNIEIGIEPAIPRAG